MPPTSTAAGALLVTRHEVIRTSVEDRYDRWLEDETAKLRAWVGAWRR